MRFLRFAAVFFPAVITAMMLLPNSLPGQSGEDTSTLTAQIDQLKKEGRFQEAIPLAVRLLAVNESIHGPDDPNIAAAASNLANLYRVTGRFTEAEPLFRRALAIQERAPRGPDRPPVAQILMFLARIYNQTGRFTEAEPLLERALEIRQRAGIRRPEAIAFNLVLLAEAYHHNGRQAESETLIKRALEIWDRNQDLPPEAITFSLTLIAKLYRESGRYAEAEPLIKRSLEICEGSLGANHPNVAFGLTNLAIVYRNTGRYTEMESLYKRALAIWEKSLGENHPAVSVALNNLGFYYGAHDKHPEAHASFKRSLDIQDSLRESIFTLLTEKQKLSYMKTQELGIYGYVSHALSLPPRGSQTAVIDVFNAWLRWKGSVMEAQGRYMDALSASDDPKVRATFNELTAVNRDIARLQLAGPGKMAPEEYAGKMSELQEKKGSIEPELMAGSMDFMLQKKARTADIKTLSSTLSRDTVYLDYAKVTLFDFRKKQWAEPHYLLFLFIPGDADEIRLLDMGASERVDRHIRAYLGEMARAKSEGALPSEKELKVQASILYDLLIKPVELSIKGKGRLLISPDGNLNLIPFETLMNSTGSYLIEDFLISYVGAGRDMVKFARPSLSGGESLIMADPDYDLGQKEMDRTKASANVRTASIRGHISRDASGMRFHRLPDTKQEADAIEKILRNKFGQKVSNQQNRKAMEYILFGMSSPRILHLATHGYFLTEEETKRPEQIPEFSSTGNPLQDLPDTIENPMLRSGIVLAGANTSLQEGRDEGMVTAEKVLGLDLKGTDLVVLSACQTGVGDIQGGEGVFGLKRAFILSGAKTLVMSLWSVPSRETVDLMTTFYTLLSEGKTPSQALRQSKLALMKQKPHPFFWGAFVLTGSP
ncbi:MAG: CHAT domain-containing protein [Syntrophorhabdaceae bacterium]|nr:CHAT domain-containing protein [Syntrophorhabdaceae bacterium]